MILQGRYRPTQLRVLLESTLAQSRRKHRLYAFISVFGTAALAVAVIAGFVLGQEGLTFLLVFVGIVVWLFGAAAIFGRARRIEAKLQFALGFLDQVFQDLHPARKITYHLDLGRYDTSVKQFWAGTSRHGNAKYRYRDVWLRQKFQLVDGTEVVLRRKADVKVRKGTVQREKRCMLLKVRPNPRTLGGLDNLNGYAELVQQRIREGFHDRPEAIKVKPTTPTDPRIRIQVDQWDAPILATEAFLVLETTILFLRMRG